ncbi:hypothetical protein [Pontibacter cellulosilyticus]|uniref:DUF5017 domain-containing protein n=1 Tax=Pontibacter cellulosilyticus TaxID=1720253 RepID=A0A923N7G2_9BACT|nr:hypothetical protein [Pontibacter cellulosilyticus]MBC5993621.1 hypothetical protein [Pontibacter cellulosilyticus]
MKKIFYLLSSLMLVFTACDPMEDVYEELDKQYPDVYTKDMNIELAKKDYELLKGKPVAKNYYFASEKEAAELIPTILDKNYPQMGNGTSVTVAFNKLAFEFKGNKISSFAMYTVTDEDYSAMGHRFSNFDSSNEMIEFLEYKYPDAVENMKVILTFDYYTGTTNRVRDAFYFLNGAWRNIYFVTNDDYALVDRGRYDNFTSADDDMLPVFFNKFLSDNIIGAEAGDVEYVSYAYFSGGKTTHKLFTMIYDGTKWNAVTENVTTPAVLAFAKKDGVWKPDLTVRYTLAAADYQWIASNPALGTETNRTNLANYGNFYQSNPNSSNYWSNEQIVAALGALLKNKYPNSEVGQKYQLTYAAYNSGNITVTVTLELQSNGSYAVI